MSTLVKFYYETILSTLLYFIILISSGVTVYTLYARRKFSIKYLNREKFERIVVLKPFAFLWCLVVCVCSVVFFFTTLVPSYKDVPYASAGNYASIEGYVTDCTIHDGGKVRTVLQIKDAKGNDTIQVVFHNYGTKHVDGDKVLVHYLSNTSYGISIEGVS